MSETTRIPGLRNHPEDDLFFQLDQNQNNTSLTSEEQLVLKVGIRRNSVLQTDRGAMDFFEFTDEVESGPPNQRKPLYYRKTTTQRVSNVWTRRLPFTKTH